WPTCSARPAPRSCSLRATTGRRTSCSRAEASTSTVSAPATARRSGARRPDAVAHAGRASALAGWLLRVPSCGLLDYEYVDVTVARVTHHCILHPRVMDASVLVQRGVPARLLRPFEGLKEDLTFAGVELADVEPADLPGLQHGLSRVLVRPPAEESHYYRSESGELARELLRHLAAQEG